MKGRARILLCVVVLVFIWSVLAASQIIYKVPLDRLLRPGVSIVKYDRTAYYFYNNEPITVTLTKIDIRYTELKVSVVGPIPTTIVTLYWDSSPLNFLTIESGGDNTWTLDSETGYAEK
jgi:hypothetical protein